MKKQKSNKVVYKIAFCDEKDLSTKFGEEPKDFTTYESAKYMIFSKVNGWGNSIINIDGDKAQIGECWLIIYKKVVQK